MKPQRWRIIGIGLLSALVIAGCASMQDEKKLYDRLGGLPTIRLIVDDFVGRVGSDIRINRFFKDSNVALVKERHPSVLRAVRWTLHVPRGGHEEFA